MLKAQNTIYTTDTLRQKLEENPANLESGIISGHVPLLTGMEAIQVMTPQKWLKMIQVKYRKSKNIHLVDESENFETLRKWRIMGSLTPKLESEDNDFIAFFSIQPNNSQPPFILKDKVVYEEKEIHRYLLRIRANLAISLNKKRDDISFNEIEQFIEYKPASYAKDIFNADTVITYPLSLGGEYLRRKYNHCDVWLFHKINVGYFSLYCFYTTKGYKHKKNYEQELEKIIRFKK